MTIPNDAPPPRRRECTNLAVAAAKAFGNTQILRSGGNPRALETAFDGAMAIAAIHWEGSAPLPCGECPLIGCAGNECLICIEVANVCDALGRMSMAPDALVLVGGDPSWPSWMRVVLVQAWQPLGGQLLTPIMTEDGCIWLLGSESWALEVPRAPSCMLRIGQVLLGHYDRFAGATRFRVHFADALSKVQR